ncbi:MAG: transposase, partial [Chloroflexota bacterium]
MVKLGKVAVDGTKIKANASKHKAMSYDRMKLKEEVLQKEIRELLQRAEAADRDEDQRFGPDKRGDELPAELARRETRLKKIQEAKAALEQQARDKATAQGKDPATARPEDKSQRNFTDPESKIQKTGDGFIQGYNAQATVDDTFQVIVAQHVTPVGNDVKELEPAVGNIERVLGDKPEIVLADAGYWSQTNAEFLQREGIEGYIATGRQKHREVTPPPPRGRPPGDMTLRERMARTLRTVKGKKLYARRK